MSLAEFESRLPKILYRYGIFEKYFPRIITENILYLNHPERFADLHDCRLRINFERDKIIESYYKDLSLNPNLSKPMAMSLARYNYKENFGSEDLLEERINQFHRLFNQILGVCSCTQTNDNFYLWRNYCDSFKGFCVGFDIKNQVNWTQGYSLNEVDYVEKLPVLDYPLYEILQIESAPINYEFYSFFVNLVFTKLKTDGENVYEAEKEWRFVKQLLEPHISYEQQRNFILPSTAYKEIVFGCNMAESKKYEIKSIAEKKGMNVNYKTARPGVGNTVIIEPFV